MNLGVTPRSFIDTRADSILLTAVRLNPPDQKSVRMICKKWPETIGEFAAKIGERGLNNRYASPYIKKNSNGPALIFYRCKDRELTYEDMEKIASAAELNDIYSISIIPPNTMGLFDACLHNQESYPDTTIVLDIASCDKMMKEAEEETKRIAAESKKIRAETEGRSASNNWWAGEAPVEQPDLNNYLYPFEYVAANEGVSCGFRVPAAHVAIINENDILPPRPQTAGIRFLPAPWSMAEADLGDWGRTVYMEDDEYSQSDLRFVCGEHRAPYGGWYSNIVNREFRPIWHRTRDIDTAEFMREIFEQIIRRQVMLENCAAMVSWISRMAELIPYLDWSRKPIYIVKSILYTLFQNNLATPNQQMYIAQMVHRFVALLHQGIVVQGIPLNYDILTAIVHPAIMQNILARRPDIAILDDLEDDEMESP